MRPANNSISFVSLNRPADRRLFGPRAPPENRAHRKAAIPARSERPENSPVGCSQRGRASFSLPPCILPGLFPECAKRSREPRGALPESRSGCRLRLRGWGGEKREGGRMRAGRATAKQPCTSPRFLHEDVHFPQILATARTRARKQAKCTASCRKTAEMHAETGIRRAF